MLAQCSVTKMPSLARVGHTHVRMGLTGEPPEQASAWCDHPGRVTKGEQGTYLHTWAGGGPSSGWCNADM